MRYEAKKTLIPTPYNSNRFRGSNDVLIEIVINLDHKAKMYLYYITQSIALGLDDKDRLYYVDKIAKRGFKEGVNCEAINIYDSYSVEHLKFDYSDKRYNAVEYLMIYANGLAKPALKFYYKSTDNNPMSYEYHAVVKNQ